MADVLIVCVREDEPQAKALAEMFEAAGFSVGGAPSSDAALRGSGAGLVVWSQASIRSRPFLDAAQRVINAQKAVVASLIEPPPPSSIGDSPAFDLSGWTGDPNDPSLDPLFFAIDRMVNSARAEMIPAAQRYQQQDDPPARPAPRYDAPPRAPPPPPYARRAPPASEPPAASTPTGFNMRSTRGDQLGSEAEHWRAIRNSRNPADFMDYLARYGVEGAFADVAELRLKQLTSAPEPQRDQRAPVRAPPPPPAVRLDAPRRAEAPRRVETPPPRREPPPRKPIFERNFDRGSDLRDPGPKAGGGGLRAFILIAVLGALALAGGLYFGNGAPQIGTPSGRDEAANDIGPPPDASAIPQTENPGSVPLSSAVDPSPALTPAQQRQQDRQERDRQAQRQQQQQQRPATTQRTADTTVPAPTASWSGDAAGGPTSLRPGEQASNTTGQAVVPLTLPAPGDTQLASNTTAPAARAPPPGAVLWAQRPSSRRIAELYPERAIREGRGGRVEMNCVVRDNLSADCVVVNESPAGMGFSRAALGAATAYRARPTLTNGQAAAGSRTRIAIQFQPPAN